MFQTRRTKHCKMLKCLSWILDLQNLDRLHLVVASSMLIWPQKIKVIATDICVPAGKWVGILGATGTTTMNNSYGAGCVGSSIDGQPITLFRFLTQQSMQMPKQVNILLKDVLKLLVLICFMSLSPLSVQLQLWERRQLC